MGCNNSNPTATPTFNIGAKGQACFANTACNFDLTCEKGICQDCAPGKIGCECGPQNACNPGGECNSGRCIPEGACVPGTKDCVCLASQCNPTLTCTPQGMCKDCTSDVAGCACELDRSCGDGLECTPEGTCERPDDAPLRILDTCFSPCRGDIRSEDGELIRCSAEGLFKGCLPGTDCVSGSCVADTRPRYCDDAMECPDFQTCVEGECRSTCENRNDCARGQSCYKQVCRLPCAGDDACTDDEYCHVVDTSTGYCMPLRREASQVKSETPMGSASDGVEGVGQPEHLEVSLSTDFMTLNSAKLSDSIRLVNTGDHQVEFIVKKIDHTEIRDGRSVTVTRGDQTPPLHWLKLGFAKGKDSKPAADKVDNVMGALEYDGQGNLVIEVAASAPRQWQGTIELSSTGKDSRLATQRIRIAYAARPEGRFAGDAVYFASFDTRGLDGWVGSDKTISDDDQVNNAFIRRWRDFVRYQTGQSAGRISYPELQAFLTATRDETWRNQSVKEVCPSDQDGNERNDPVCYLSGNFQGYSLYSENQVRYPVPFGGVAFPMALNIRAGGQLGTQGGIQYTGRIDSAGSMHYGGDPTINLSFAGEPTDCPNATDGRSCVVPLKTFNADIVVPGRYRDASSGCRNIGEATFQTTLTPWLVPGFPNGAIFNKDQQQFETTDCLGNDAPFALDTQANTQVARANPIPDGFPRVRRIELLDGALIDGERFIVIFREEMGSLLVPGEKVYNYGYMDLRRQGDSLEGDDYESNDQAWTEIPGGQSPLQTYSCSEELRKQAFAVGDDSIDASKWSAIDSWDVKLAENVANVMLTGQESAITATPYNNQRIHWLCRGTNVTLKQFNDANSLQDNIDTSARVVGYFNQGGSNSSDPCDESSTIHYFALPPGYSRSQLQQHDCNTNGSCHTVYDGWRSGARTTESLGGASLAIADVVFDPISDCGQNGSVTAVECTSSRQDPTQNKTFYEPGKGGFHFDPLRRVTRAAFRYRTEFLGRDGTPLGFPPEICSSDLNQTPFCYDPELIEQVRDRVDCLLSVYHVHRDKLWSGNTTQRQLAVNTRDYLTENFSSRVDYHPFGNPNLPTCEGGSSTSCLPVESMGFERLYAELLILLGDEAYTQSFASRFDLAGIRNRAFDGPAFEGPNGIELSGGVGYEMFLLYQATQYYEMVIDRFARTARAIGETTLDQRGKRLRESFDPCVGNCPALVDAPERVDWTFMTQGTVTVYMSRLLKASTQKSRAANQISKKYQTFNRPELARQVIDRFYPAAYLEFLLFSRLLDSIISVSSQQARAQLESIQRQASLTYRMALLDMRKSYGEITDDITFFGFAPDYVPIPVLADGQANSFERMFDIASNQSLIAADKEQIALASDRAARTGLVEFRSELSDIRTEYETQLGELCGYVEGSDGKLYPSIARYAHLFRDAEGLQGSNNEALAIAFQEPCGRFGSGDLFEASVEQIEAQLDYQQSRKIYETHLKTVEALKTRTQKVCNETFDFSTDSKWSDADGRATDLSDRIDSYNGTIAKVDLAMSIVSTTAGATSGCADSIAGAAGAIDPLSKAGAIAAAATSCGAQAVGAAADISNASTSFALNNKIADLQGELDDNERTKSIRESIYQNCAAAQADEGPAIVQTIGDVISQQIEILKKSQQLTLKAAAIKRLRNQLRILEAEYDEKSQLAIDAAAAANDPNVRIYRNDEIIAADRTFNRAIKSAYKATKVFEYYTGQSYEARDKLLLSRTVAYGDYGLEAYLEELEDGYIAYQELYGSPDRRVLIKSLREDILFADLYDDNGEPMSQEARDETFKALLADEKWLDKNSYITIPFALNVEETSPLTHNHKLDYIRAEIVYDGRTDVLARIYLRPAGTSMLRTDGGDPFFYRMPSQITVINPSFNGAFLQQAEGSITSDDLDEEIFYARRLRDRPLLNTQWEMVLNLVDEQVNKDLLLDEIKDIRLFFYYNDFTGIPR